MALLSPPSRASAPFHQSNAPIRTASLSETHLGQSAGGPSRRSTNENSAFRPLVGLENGRASPQISNGLENGLVNGHGARRVASSEPNNGFEPQSIPRARIENHQALARRPKTSMTRSKTDYKPEKISSTREGSVEEHGELRHGWEDEYNSSEFLGQLNSVHLHMLFTASTEFNWLMLSVDFLHVLHRQTT